ncbi:MAG: NAD-dependent epimerase/dehydratase family protein [Actinomycetia bacterium]|nr:NAD-dependent epimerase/dehydratase family protein [Actinomycetes bacterium]
MAEAKRAVRSVASGLRVAVTGAAGSIGSKLVGRLAASDDVGGIIAFDARAAAADHAKVAVFRQDIRQPIASVLREYGVNAVVHLAFLLRPGRDREAARRVNMGGTEHVLRECRAAGVRQLLYLSSTTVYGPHPGDPQPYTENSPVRPVRGFRYAEDKAATELMLEAYAADNPETCVTVLRGCPVMGPRSENFVTQAFRKLAAVRVLGADPHMQFLHEDDLLETLELCLLEQVPGVYNVTGEGTVALSEVATVAGRRPVAVPGPLLALITQASWMLRLQSVSPSSGLAMLRWPWLASNEKLAREVRLRPRHTSREALEASPLARSK